MHCLVKLIPYQNNAFMLPFEYHWRTVTVLLGAQNVFGSNRHREIWSPEGSTKLSATMNSFFVLL